MKGDSPFRLIFFAVRILKIRVTHNVAIAPIRFLSDFLIPISPKKIFGDVAPQPCTKNKTITNHKFLYNTIISKSESIFAKQEFFVKGDSPFRLFHMTAKKRFSKCADYYKHT
ncbi:MAG: hypothetical protein E7394_06985 [Ruminococcaceae bacterium]|nr:hypothetical protein [Oscillospiraceae bacterium]